jgi:copper chaperone CopZ
MKKLGGGKMELKKEGSEKEGGKNHLPVKVEKRRLAIKGMHCRSCEMLITDSLMEMDGVSKTKVDHEKGFGEVEFDPKKTDIKRIMKAVKEQGYDCKAVI